MAGRPKKTAVKQPKPAKTTKRTVKKEIDLKSLDMRLKKLEKLIAGVRKKWQE